MPIIFEMGHSEYFFDNQAYGDLNLRTWYQSDLALRLRSATSRCQGDVVYFTDQAMTKHYFIAGAALSLSKRQRIASKLVESLAPEASQNLKGRPVEGLTSPTEASEWGSKMVSRIKRDFDCVGLDYNAFYPGETRIEALEVLQTAPETNEYQLFFYHSDHLGSSSFITDINGDATQHLQYLPFGEDFVHQQNTAAYYTPYTFSGKERDMETNLSYFGARYYESSLSVWLSVDPMSDKYPHQSPFTYCSNNPVMLFDPDGKEDYEVDRQGRIRPALDENGKHRGAGQPDRLIAGKATYDDKGNLTSENFETFSNGFISTEVSKEKVTQNIKQNGKTMTVKYDWTKIEAYGGGDEFEKAFKFLAANTDVEWTLAEYSNPSTNATNYVLSTSHKHEADYFGGTKALNAPLSLLSHTHSHPNNPYYDNDGQLKMASSNPSDNDLLFKAQLQAKGSTAKLFILNRGKKEPY